MPRDPDPQRLRRLAADLREARRYCRTDPDEAFRQARDAFGRLDDDDRADRLIVRLMTNVAAGVLIARSCPDVLAGYLEGAAVELSCRASRREPRDEPGDANARPPRPAWRKPA